MSNTSHATVRRALTVLMSLSMILSSTPVPALAEPDAEVIVQELDKVVEDADGGQQELPDTDPAIPTEGDVDGAEGVEDSQDAETPEDTDPLATDDDVDGLDDEVTDDSPVVEEDQAPVVADVPDEVEEVVVSDEEVSDQDAQEGEAEAQGEKTERRLQAQAAEDEPVERIAEGKAAFIQEGITSKAIEPVIVSESPKRALTAQATTTPDLAGAKEAILAGLLVGETEIDIKSFNVPLSKVGTIYSEVVDANPDLWYVSSGYRYSYSGAVVSVFKPQYMIDPTTSTYKTMKSKYEAEMESLLSSVPAGATTVDKVKAVHDWLVIHLTYFVSYANNPSSLTITAQNNPHSAYGALVTKKPVCEGYTLAYMAALKRLGVDATTALNLYASHIWNRVKVGSSWYHVDVTWDDPIGGIPAYAYTDYFLKSDSGLKSYASTHEGSYPTHDRWSDTGLKCSSTTYDNRTASSWPTFLTAASVTTSNAVYTGTAIKPAVTVILGNKTLSSATDYTVSCKNASGTAVSSISTAGTYTISVKGKGKYTGTSTKTAKMVVTRGKANPITVAVQKSKLSLKYSVIKSKAYTISTNNLKVSNAKGTLSYANVSTQTVTKKFTVNKKTGKVTVLKGTKKGTYTLKVRVTAAGNSSYFKKSVTVSYKIVVK